MKKFVVQIVLLVAVVLIATFLTYNQGFIAPYVPVSQNLPQKQIRINQTVINAEVADTTDARSRGLSGRSGLDPDSGMLFVFQGTAKPRFWMKGMKFPLDLIFIREGKVVDVLQNVPAPTINQKDSDLPVYEPAQMISMMLEVNAGFADNKNIRVGDEVFLVQQ